MKFFIAWTEVQIKLIEMQIDAQIFWKFPLNRQPLEVLHIFHSNWSESWKLPFHLHEIFISIYCLLAPSLHHHMRFLIYQWNCKFRMNGKKSFSIWHGQISGMSNQTFWLFVMESTPDLQWSSLLMIAMIIYSITVLFYDLLLTLLLIIAWDICNFLALMDATSWPTASNLLFIQSSVIGASGGYDTFTFFATSATSWSFSEQLSSSVELWWHLKSTQEIDVLISGQTHQN